MALVLADRVKETTTTTGTGTVTLAGASAGYQSFAAIGNGNTTYYTISGQTTSEWEVGIGTYTSVGTTLSRTTVLSSSNGGSLVTFSSGTKDVFVTYPSSRSIYADGAVLTATNSSVLPVSSGGTGVTTSTGSGSTVLSTSPTLVTPALGTPSSGTVTNLTGTASININGTVGATTPATGAFTTLSATGLTQLTGGSAIGGSTAPGSGQSVEITYGAIANTGRVFSYDRTGAARKDLLLDGANVLIAPGGSTVGTFSSTGLAVTGALSATGNVTLSGGTANGVAYLNGSKVLTTGSALTFDGSAFWVIASSVSTDSLNTAGFKFGAGTFKQQFSAGFDFQQFYTSAGQSAPDASVQVGSGYYALKLAGNEQTRLTSTGLGIGTSSPAYKLDVQASGYPAISVASTLGSGTNGAYFQAKNGSAAVSFFGTETTAGGYSYTGAIANSAYIGSASTNPLQLVTNSIARATIDSSGNFLVGATTQNGRLTVKNPSVSGNQVIYAIQAATSTTQLASWDLNQTTDVSTFGTDYGAPLAFKTNSTERARIDSSGNFRIGITGAAYNTERLTVYKSGNVESAAFVNEAGANNYTVAVSNRATTGDNKFMVFATESGDTTRGSITYNRAGGLTVFNTTSDYRAKDISGPVTGSGALIDSIPVYMGKMKWATEERPMFIAHETPVYAHTGVKDAVDADGNPVYQQMDASALIPVMWAELQSLRARVAQLESKP